MACLSESRRVLVDTWQAWYHLRRHVPNRLRVAPGLWLGLACILAGGAACTTPEGRPPIARITLSPEAILSDDQYQTAVTLDGTRSKDVDDPDGTAPLEYRWTIEGDAFRFESGTDTSAMPVVRFQGERPATIGLTVVDRDGLDAFAVAHVQLTVR
jgi:hypothetical protein